MKTNIPKFLSIALLTVAASASSAGTFDHGLIRLDIADRGAVFDATTSGLVTLDILPPDGEKITVIESPSRTCSKQCVFFVNVLTDQSPQPYVVKLLTSPGTAKWLH
jgi:hypothetical protein